MSTHVHDIAVLPGWETGNSELDQRFLRAMADKNIDAVMTCFIDSPDLCVVLWGKEMRGPDQVRASVMHLFNSYDEVKLAIDRVSEFPSGDAVLAVGQATYTLTLRGEITKIREVWTDVRRKIDGRWVYVLDHAEILH